VHTYTHTHAQAHTHTHAHTHTQTHTHTLAFSGSEEEDGSESEDSEVQAEEAEEAKGKKGKGSKPVEMVLATQYDHNESDDIGADQIMYMQLHAGGPSRLYFAVCRAGEACIHACIHASTMHQPQAPPACSQPNHGIEGLSECQ
jgi:hypothetical protein